MGSSTGDSGDLRAQGLLIPADPTKPVSLVDLIDESESRIDILRRLVGGSFDVQAHAEGDFWLNDEGRLIDLPINVRVNHWALSDSAASRQNLVGESTMVYGDVVMTGSPDVHGGSSTVDPQMVVYFQGLRLHPSALKDWDVRSVEWTFRAWPDGSDLGFGM